MLTVHFPKPILALFCLISFNSWNQTLSIDPSASYSFIYDYDDTVAVSKQDSETYQLQDFDSVVIISKTNDIGHVSYKLWKSHLDDSDVLKLKFDQYAFCDSLVKTTGVVGKQKKTKVKQDFSCYNQQFPGPSEMPEFSTVKTDNSEIRLEKEIIIIDDFTSGSERKGSKTIFWSINSSLKRVQYESVSRGE